MCPFCHVRIPKAWHALLPVTDFKEDQNLGMCDPPADPLSRLACQIYLQPEHDGITVALTHNNVANDFATF
jgi:ferredoxin